MTTTIAIYVDKDKTFVSTFPEEMDLDSAMFIDSDSYRYSIGTSDTTDTRAKVLYLQMLQSLRTHLGTKRTVQKVLFSNSDEHVTLRNAVLTFTKLNTETFLEVSAKDAEGKSGTWEYSRSKVLGKGKKKANN
jgi:hypothetical protein